jgi:hypothetical protein
MREIRSRISERHGIDLTSQQIQELAARRLEAILDPRTIKPSLMDELRRAAGLPPDTPAAEPPAEVALNESALYESGNGLLRAIRRLLNPILKLFFNPAAIIESLNGLGRRANAAESREAEQRRRQAEWNGLHFEVLRRLVIEIARVEIDNQHLAHRVESLMARVDFNERRVRGLEQSQHQTRPAGRPAESSVVSAAPSSPREETASVEHASNDASPDGGRRRRRRRRGRRSGQPRDITGLPTAGMAAGVVPTDPGIEGDDFGDEDGAPDELIEEAGSSSAASDDQAPPAAFEPPSLPSEEPLTVAPTEIERIPEPTTSEDAPSPVAAETVDRPDQFPPEQS